MVLAHVRNKAETSATCLLASTLQPVCHQTSSHQTTSSRPSSAHQESSHRSHFGVTYEPVKGDA